jgi:hypothetical protein
VAATRVAFHFRRDVRIVEKRNQLGLIERKAFCKSSTCFIIHRFLVIYTERRGRVINTPASYSVVLEFKSRRGDRLS